MEPIKQGPQAFSLPDVTKLLKIQLSPSEIDAILTIIGLALRSLGISGLTDVVSLLLKMEQSWAAGAANTPVATPASTTSSTPMAPKA